MTESGIGRDPLAPSDDSLFPTAGSMEGNAAMPEGDLATRTVEDDQSAGMTLKVRSQWSYARMRFFRHRLAVAGLLGLIIIFGAGIFAGEIAPYGYAQIDLTHILEGPSHLHYFGTDALGRDQYTRVLWGIRT